MNNVKSDAKKKEFKKCIEIESIDWLIFNLSRIGMPSADRSIVSSSVVYSHVKR
jgi:hypothetical protein